MKRIFQHNLRMLLAALFLTISFRGQDTLSKNDNEIILWMQQNSIPIAHVEAENGFSDLQPLKEILKDVKVVGLGENTHGTREFFQIKHRLLEFLVQEMGFNAFAIEASYADCLPINDYVLHGKGKREDVLTGQGYVVWDTQEVSTMIDWIRTYNKNLSDDKKVRFFGFDFGYNNLGAQKVSAYLRKNSFVNIQATDSLLHAIATLGNKNWPMTTGEIQTDLKAALPRLQELTDFLIRNKEKLNSADTREHDEIMLHISTMKQFLLNNIKDSLPESAHPNMVRSRSMATNLFRILDIDKSVEKTVVWAHDSHISVGQPEMGEPNMGYELRKKFGGEYYAVGFEFNKGSYQSRFFSSDGLGDLKNISVASAPKGYMAWYLSHALNGNGWLNLRSSLNVGFIRKWLNAPQIFRSYNWLNDPVSLQRAIPAIRYDGILFIEHTTPAIPTQNALRRASKGEGF